MFDFLVGCAAAAAFGASLCVGWKVAQPVGDRLANALDRGFDSLGWTKPGLGGLAEQAEAMLQGLNLKPAAA